ncbi:zinc ribbon domain-containing protein [Methanoregula sp.]|uniref:zinc ribbon domain-containing protein n=1 Tax=Methanoregula sp. TaxID=2052170 RepID=UPI002373838F|nr:zinc ribbon domain-containing protein [Methanoregula sp.]MDD1685604.1 zinc ribbon domain-containing protein [Methanoregula sp.]
MGDPDLNNGEQVLIRTPGILVKAIPFEGILTGSRMILVDRLKKIIPTREIPLSAIQYVESGENAVQDPILTISVEASPGEARQMVLTFSRQAGGNRARIRDEWVRIILAGIASRRTQAATPQRVPVKRVVETGTPMRSPVSPAPAPAPAARQPEIPPSGASVFCSRCGNRVPVGSVFCNRCGTPIVSPVQAQQQPPAPRQQYTPAPAAEPVFDAPPSIRIPPVQAPPAPAPVQPVVEKVEHVPVSRPVSVAQPVQKPVKKGFFSRIFSSGGKKAAAKPSMPPIQPAPERKTRRGLMPGKKALMAGVIVIILIIVIAAGALVVYPMLSSGVLAGSSSSSGTSSSGSSSTSGTLTNTGVASITVKETTAPTVPVSGVWVMVDYIGSYDGTYGMSSDIQSVKDSGSRLYEVVNASGLIKVSLTKQDSSTKHELVVSIYKDGALLKSDSTSASYGKVSISTDVGGTPETVSTVSASTTTGNVTSQTTVATNTTAAITTVKTTAKTTTTTKAATIKTTTTTKVS